MTAIYTSCCNSKNNDTNTVFYAQGKCCYNILLHSALGRPQRMRLNPSKLQRLAEAVATAADADDYSFLLQLQD